MNEVSLHRLDLNLLVIFDVVMAEGSITRAAARLGRTQSAVSHALERLREQIGDPLLVKMDGRMRPSPFALTLVEDVRPILRSIQRVVAPPETFDPRTSKRAFKIAIPAFTALLSALCARVHAAAPGVSLEWMKPNVHATAAVAEGLIDMGHIGGDTRLPDGVEVHVAQPFSWLTFARKGHPALSDWCIDSWTAWPHVAVSIGNDVPDPIEQAMKGLGKARRIGARIPNFSGVAALISETNMLATFPPLALAGDVKRYGLCALPPPIGLPPFSSRFFWGSRGANDPGSRWIRQIVLETFAKLQASAERSVDVFVRAGAPRRSADEAPGRRLGASA